MLKRSLRRKLAGLRVDISHAHASGFAIYTLSDPRDMRLVRYVGQTASPGRRHAQHIAAARLWMPDDIPWWIRRPELRPLYAWIRTLHADEGRLPVMVVAAWCPRSVDARALERETIMKHLAEGMPLLNRENVLLGTQIPLATIG